MKKINKTWLTIFAIATVLSIAFGAYQYVTAQNYERDLNNQYTRSFYEFSESMQNISSSLEKGMLISNASQMVRLSNEINQKTQAAKTSLSQLPFEKTHIDQITKFLTQTGDFTYSLAMKLTSGQKMNEADYASLKELVKYSREINASIDEIQNQISAGKVTVSEASSNFKGDIKTIDMSLEDLSNYFVEYPSLIYDGPFSAHIEGLKAKMLEDKKEISRDEALQKAKWFLNSGDKLIEVTGEVDGSMPAYNIICYPEGKESSHIINVDISKAGGYVIWYLDNRSSNSSVIDVNQAKINALEYLSNKGFNSLKDSYYEVLDNIATINFAYVQDGVIMYGDLIKIKVALDNGSVIGMESKGYLMSHIDKRALPPASVTKNEILDKLPSGLQINNVSMAVIPKDDLSEVYCFEVKGSINERNFLIYFDAQTGMEIKILMLLETETGILSI